MAAPDATKARLSRGVLAANGTDLGIIGNVVLRPPNLFRVLDRLDDNGPDGVVLLGGRTVLGGVLRGWEDDAVATLIQGGAAGPAVTWPFGVGQTRASIASVTFTSRKVGNPLITMTSCYAVLDIDAELMFASQRYLEPRVVIIGNSCTIGVVPEP